MECLLFGFHPACESLISDLSSIWYVNSSWFHLQYTACCTVSWCSKLKNKTNTILPTLSVLDWQGTNAINYWWSTRLQQNTQFQRILWYYGGKKGLHFICQELHETTDTTFICVSLFSLPERVQQLGISGPWHLTATYGTLSASVWDAPYFTSNVNSTCSSDIS